jgi:thiosulfate/3-mercaptopyruvate sulfurtransferase
MQSVITAEELRARLPAVRILDARSGEAGRRSYREAHLVGAAHADLDSQLSAAGGDAARGGRHPLPDLSTWRRQLGAWGIDASTPVAIYDDHGGANAAARCWWMIRALGHGTVAVLEGGFAAAVEVGIATEAGVPPELPSRPPYRTTGWQLSLATIEDVETHRNDTGWRVLDVRDEARFRGEEEPYDPVAGHIPGARNLPYRSNLDEAGGFKSEAELAAQFEKVLGTTPPERVIVHCGSGVTACHTLLAMERAGLSGARLYVGSWSEWCRNDREMAKGTK